MSESVITNCMGLLLSSVQEPWLGWAPARTCGLESHLNLADEAAVPRIQVLPAGAPPQAAKRINIVTTFRNVNASFELLSDLLWKWLKGADIEEKLSTMPYLKEIQLNQVRRRMKAGQNVFISKQFRNLLTGVLQLSKAAETQITRSEEAMMLTVSNKELTGKIGTAGK